MKTVYKLGSPVLKIVNKLRSMLCWYFYTGT